MNCYLHPETPAIAFCRACGRPLCSVCQRSADGTVYCQDHVPSPAYSAPNYAGGNYAGGNYSAGSSYTAPPYNPAPDPPAGTSSNPYFQPAPGVNPVRRSPVLAFILGFIPGVGAIYNGQYLKGLLHALIFGLLVTLVSNSGGAAEPLIGMLLAAFLFYMPFEAFHTAKHQEAGVPVEEWSSIIPNSPGYRGRTPVGPIVLILVGVLYLLNSLDIIDFHEVGRYWPVILIAIGAYMLYSRTAGPRTRPPFTQPPPSSPAPGAPATDFMETRHEQ